MHLIIVERLHECICDKCESGEFLRDNLPAFLIIIIIIIRMNQRLKRGDAMFWLLYMYNVYVFMRIFECIVSLDFAN